jgi:RNA:NAD 2'-phosphotransferase (TPT1/KptA family)
MSMQEGEAHLSHQTDARDTRERMPDVARVLALIGEPINSEFLDQYARRYGSGHLNLLIDSGIDGETFWSAWREAGSREYRELFELLALEDRLCNQPAQISSGFRPGLKLDKTIHTIRQNIALALYDRARELASSQPLTSVRVLKVAERYLEEVCTHEHLSRDVSRSGFLGRLGVAVVLQARHTEVEEEALEKAIARMRESIARGNDAPEAGAYLSEGLLRLADLKRERGPLVEIIKQGTGHIEEGTFGHALTVAEAWLHLSEYAESARGKKGFLDHAISVAESVATSAAPSVMVRRSLICAMAVECRTSGFSPRGLRLPFGLRAHMRIWSTREPDNAAAALDRLIVDLENGPFALPHFGLGRRTLASLMSVRARVAQTDPNLAAELLTKAIDIRFPARQGLGEAESQLENALDTMALFELQGRNRLLAQTCTSLLDLAQSDITWATPVLLLADIAERYSDSLTPSVKYELSRSSIKTADAGLSALLDGDSSTLYQIAARRALASSEVDRRPIGGRSGVFRAADYTGLLEDVFVFKPSPTPLADRDDLRSESIRSTLAKEDLLYRFNVATTLARTPLATDDMLHHGQADVVTARRFHSGQLLSQLKGRPQDEILPVLTEAAEFLSIIHSCESRIAEPPAKVRRELRRKEFGYWLREGLRFADIDSVFQPWWSLLSTVPVVPRRDAHPFNWIIGDDRTIIAVDLEACGWRPIGYELAQLTDDVALLPVDDDGFRCRATVMDRYRKGLTKRGINVDPIALQNSYEASLIARSVRHLTNQEMNEAERIHGVSLLDWLKSHGSHEQVRELCAVLIDAWNVRRGGGSEGTLSVGRRRHLSRAMAYQLRHGDTLIRDAEGWANLASLSEALRQDGIHTDTKELIIVASAIDEVRFEVAGEKVRALYGHSQPVSITYERAVFSGELYHGTASSSLNAILQSRQGLIRMKRNWVHLSRDPMLAARTARRHGAYTILSVKIDQADEVLHPAGTVHLMESIAAERLRIITPARLLFLQSATENRST